eukprot:scaffold9394_cov107-Skeletonema_marinoi.AAC.1
MMSCPWSHNSACGHVQNMVHGVVEHGRFGDVFFCEILRPNGRARQSSDRNFTGRTRRPSKPFSPPMSSDVSDEDETNDTNVEA